MEISVLRTSHRVIVEKPLSIIRRLLKNAIKIVDRTGEGRAYGNLGIIAYESQGDS